jgi:NADH-quinone oxidoreductase subunit K
MIPVEHYIALSAVLFTIGGVAFLVRRNIVLMLLGIEVMLNAVNLALVAYNRMRPEAHSGQILSFFLIAAEAAELAIGLAIVLAFYRLKKTVRVDDATLLRH